MINLGDAVLFFKGDMNDLDRALGDARAAAEDSMGNIKQLAQEAGMAMTAMGAAITGALGFAVTDFANTGDEVNDLSKKIGFSTETVSKWAFALGQSGGDMSLLQTGVRGLANQIDGELRGATEGQAAAQDKISEAYKKSEDAIQDYNLKVNATPEEYLKLQRTLRDTDQAIAEANASMGASSGAFQRLGLDAAALKALAPEDQFMRVALAVAAIPDPMERAVLAQDMFGKAGMDLLPVLSEGEAGLRAMFDQAERSDMVFSQEQADMADAYNDALGGLSASAAGAAKELAMALIPSLISTIEWVKKNVIAFKDWTQENPVLVASLTKVTAAVGGFLFVAGPLLIILPGIVTAVGLIAPAFAAVKVAVLAVAGAIDLPLIAIVAAVVAIGYAAYKIYENWDEITAFFEDFWGNLGRMFEDGKKMIAESDLFQGIKESATEATEYSISKLGELAGFVSGNLSQALTDPVDFIAEYWEWLGSVFDSVYLGVGRAWDFLMTNVLEPAWNWLKSFYDWISEIFLSAFDKAAAESSGLSLDDNTMPAFARGTRSAPGGMAWVGEEGPELMYVPRGAQVYPAQQSAAMAGGGATVSINIGSVSLPSRAAIQEFNRGLGDEVARRLSARGMQPRIA